MRLLYVTYLWWSGIVVTYALWEEYILLQADAIAIWVLGTYEKAIQCAKNGALERQMSFLVIISSSSGKRVPEYLLISFPGHKSRINVFCNKSS